MVISLQKHTLVIDNEKGGLGVLYHFNQALLDGDGDPYHDTMIHGLLGLLTFSVIFFNFPT